MGKRMGRVYGEPVTVRTAPDGRPAGFTWRKRHYTVSSVQEYWLVNRDWWRESAPVPARPELEFWRVEAAAGSPGASPAGSYELRRDIAAGRWTLRRVAD
jgi:hypothetical protein